MSQKKKMKRRPGTQSELHQSQGEDMDVEEDQCPTQTQTASQMRPNLEKPSMAQVDQKVNELVQYLLVKDQKKLPIKRADILRNVIKEYKGVSSEIVKGAGQVLEKVFGLHLKEIDQKNHVYIIVNMLERLEGDNMRVDDNTAKMGLLMVILSLIFMKGSATNESVIWETLRKLRVDTRERHEVFGDVKKLVTEEFVRQKYLEYNRIPHTEPVEFEFQWGARATKETTKMQVLNFVAKIQKKDPKSWTVQYSQATEGASASGAPLRH
ncbi:non-structural maintenance of chromosomes element 3 homolog isoform X2 [Ornithorhynchus anatinus]|uniref:MAGE domain-containing protein n=2 Tax=Ornithorhynchus anatinus TaxID=9258 RepID=F7CAS5_ORNAN|nr:non-structural maintenance of chromosomes element 3 homolog isoform X2 [Ornithorhynchus anatinus]XP_028923574.1 non-structural maintenance of chromosomes element 3 homolog isoform X2 [Ornithorhynchus anatinus]